MRPIISIHFPRFGMSVSSIKKQGVLLAIIDSLSIVIPFVLRKDWLNRILRQFIKG